MENASLINVSRQESLTRALDVIANNIANANTTGFKAERVLFEPIVQRPAEALDGPEDITFVNDYGLVRDFTPGGLDTTGGTLDFALEGPGFFVVQTGETDNGPTRYTRDGRFQLDSEGRLATGSGALVLNPAGQPIQLEAEQGRVEVDTDGVIRQNDQQVGQIAVVVFESLSPLEKIGDNLYEAPAGADPDPAVQPGVRQGVIERANVEIIREITRMIEASRAYSSAQGFTDDQDELRTRTIQRLGRAN
ncbi:MAG: flagellar basal-body rod protein FlgF [Maricaulaceae bacterium]